MPGGFLYIPQSIVYTEETKLRLFSPRLRLQGCRPKKYTFLSDMSSKGGGGDLIPSRQSKFLLGIYNKTQEYSDIFVSVSA